MDMYISSYGRAGDGCPDFTWIKPEVRVDLYSLGTKICPKIGSGSVHKADGKMIWVKVDGHGEIVPVYPGQLRPEGVAR